MIDAFIESGKTVMEIVHSSASLHSVRSEYGNFHTRLKKLSARDPERYGCVKVVTREGKIYILRLEDDE